jgi:triose/dihydroxyacetone kinase / FAD-AMP lyase (cyclizing)
VQEYGGAKPGDRTMLDALVPAIDALKGGDLKKAAVAAKDGAHRTASMTKARAGRSSYVREDVLREVPDPGAVAVAAIFEALATSSS